MYWIKLYKDIRLWMKFAKVAKESRKILEKNNLRVDNLGRIYTVINLPDEAAQGNEYTHEAWVLQNVGTYTKILLEIGLADYAYPEVSRIQEPGTAAYLVVLYPEAYTINGWRFLKNLAIWIGGFFALKIIWNILNHFFDMQNVWHNLIELIF